MIACAYSLLGIFHIYTPQWVQKSATQSRAPKAKAFVSGLLAVLLATPCSAPILSVALGFAFAGSPIEIFGFHTAIALGFGMPYILGIFFPIDRFLPKPGKWMIMLEYAMGIFFLLSAAWLIEWPLSAFLSRPLQNIARIFCGLWILAPLMLCIKKYLSLEIKKWIFYRIPLVMASVFIFFPSLSKDQGQGVSMIDGQIHWMRWNSKALEHVLKSGRTVFIDVTGAGCSLCMVNKRIFSYPSIQKLLSSPHVVCMRADYSKGSPEILKFLKQYGRVAIPFNVILHKDYPKGIVLSECLTEDEIQNALKLLKKIILTKQKDLSYNQNTPF